METKDLIVIGGGINGAGIAADAAGRGLSVLMLEAQDLACATQGIGPAWTKESVLPGGAIEGDRDDYAARLRRRYPFLTESLARHYARTYGSNSELLLGNAGTVSDLGEDFGHEFYEAELKYLVDHEWVRRADDALWRRTKQGMWLNADQQSRVSQWLVEYTQQRLSLAS